MTWGGNGGFTAVCGVVAEVNLQLLKQRYGTYSGTVIDPDQKPIPQALVTFGYGWGATSVMTAGDFHNHHRVGCPPGAKTWFPCGSVV